MYRYLCLSSSLCMFSIPHHVGSESLEEVLGTLIQGAVSFPDPVVCKETLCIAKLLIQLHTFHHTTCRFRSYALVFSRSLLLHGVRTALASVFFFLLTAVCLSCIKAAEGTLPGFVEYMYKHILPACFLAPLKPTFDLNDGHSFLVGQAVQNSNFNAMPVHS